MVSWPVEPSGSHQRHPDPYRDPRFCIYYHAQTGLLTHEIIEPDQANFTLGTSYGYDAYGHKDSVTVFGDASATDPIVTRTTTTSYDYTNLGVDGTYSTITTNALTHSETKTIDARFGVVTYLEGPNGPSLATTWEYDTLGRKEKENRADGTYTTITYDHCETANPCAPTNAALKITTQVASTTPSTIALPASIIYFDKLGREVRREGIGFDGSIGGKAVYKDTVYNDRGKIDKVTLPYFVNDTQHWTSYTYDDLGRVTQETRPDTAVVTRTYTMTINGHETVERIVHTGDGIDQSTTQLNNSLGQLIKVTDNAGGTIDYTYDAFSNLLTTTDDALVPNVVSMTYDIRGRKTAMDDPDMGHWEYTHNALGELVKQKDAKFQHVFMTYDVLGRMVSRQALGTTSTWTYDTALNGKGKLATVTAPNSSFVRTLTYDTTGRLDQTVVTIANGPTLTTQQTYDAYSRVATLTYPNGFMAKYNYHALGILHEVRDSSDALYWQADQANALGQSIMETFGNGIETIRSYDDTTGHMTGISSAVGTNPAAQLLTYDYDALGNLTTRHDAKRTLTEDFSYDGLNRLTGVDFTDATMTTLPGASYTYDSIGNITNKSDVGDYTYGENGAGPHAVTTAGGNTYTYDANGNQTGGGERAFVLYTYYNKVATVYSTGGVLRQFAYDPDRTRYKQTHNDGIKTTTTFYLGSLYEQIDKSNSAVTEYKYYIYAGKQRVAIHTAKSDTSPSTTRYIHTDHLGSIDTITKEDGTVEENLSFDAFGKRRNAGDWSVLTGLLAVMNTNRGFTGHEHLDDVGLIHMNGRVYDPTLGRFLSADPFVQFPKSTQGLNRYSYVNNNPLSYTDPSGHFFFTAIAVLGNLSAIHVIGAIALDLALRKNSSTYNKISNIAATVLSIVVPGVTTAFLQAFNSFANVHATGGSFGDAFKAGITSYATSNVMSSFSKAIGAGGANSGTKYTLGEGFTYTAPTVGNIITEAVAGGVRAELGGGKFANGAKSGSFNSLLKGFKFKDPGKGLDNGPDIPGVNRFDEFDDEDDIFGAGSQREWEENTAFDKNGDLVWVGDIHGPLITNEQFDKALDVAEIIGKNAGDYVLGKRLPVEFSCVTCKVIYDNLEDLNKEMRVPDATLIPPPF